jgi:hypothetical protein
MVFSVSMMITQLDVPVNPFCLNNPQPSYHKKNAAV